MPNFILFDDDARISLRPLTFFRPVSEIRLGILTIREKWEQLLSAPVSYLTEPYLQKKFPLVVGTDNILINSSVLPHKALVNEIQSIAPDTLLECTGKLVAIRLTQSNLALFQLGTHSRLNKLETSLNVTRIVNTWDLPNLNDQAIRDDFALLSQGHHSQELEAHCQHEGSSLFIEKGASIRFSTFDSSQGPIYIGWGAHIMQGCHIQGPAAICDHATLKMGSLIYGGTTIGPWCKAGGEISSSIMFGYSSKAHDGYLGNSVIAEWCNLGAGTTCSNLKNNYEPVKQWSYQSGRFVNTNLQFCGLAMGDHCKTGINTMFNSGTTAGVCSNIFGSGYQRNFIPSFAWGGTAGFRKHKPEETIETARVVYARRGIEFGPADEEIVMEVHRIVSQGRFL